MTGAAMTASKTSNNFPLDKKVLQYDRTALLISVKRRKKNLDVFREVIFKEQEAIKYQLYIISQINPLHADVKVLKGNIEKRKINIQTFRNAIREEKGLIKQEKAMALQIKVKMHKP